MSRSEPSISRKYLIMTVKIQMKISLTLLISKIDNILLPKVPHLNIKSFQKNFDNLFNPLMTLKFQFKVLCITETWCLDNSMNHYLFKIPQYESIRQVRRTGKGGGIAVFLQDSLTFNIRHDLSVNNSNIEALCVESINKK